MKKLIYVSLASLAVFAPSITLSQPPKVDYSDISDQAGLIDEESEVVMELFCDETFSSLEEIKDELDDAADGELSDERLTELASFVMSGQQMVEKKKDKLCDGKKVRTDRLY